MTTAIYDWPAALEAATIAFDPRGMTVAGPRTVTGRVQTFGLDAGYWVASMRLDRLQAGDQINAFRALRAQLQGGSRTVRVPANDQGQAPWASGNWDDWEDQILAANDFTDGQEFSDGTGFYNPAIVVTLAELAELRDTQIVARVTTAGTIKAGMLFSIRDRLHVIQEVVSVDEDTDGDSDQTWRIWPPLREDAWPIGLRLDFERPVCRMMLEADEAMDLLLMRIWHAEPEIRFVEAV